ncbi:hypothetical protein [Brevibacillus dissolubilis]|uniref:hypothetical protein n=1 Tax=Brevibacillus dissolubilis TaxID=1844116 RepID=UPI00159BC8B3|nr:hypothetical protein [Brevibacillus dissolubilis]
MKNFSKYVIVTILVAGVMVAGQASGELFASIKGTTSVESNLELAGTFGTDDTGPSTM